MDFGLAPGQRVVMSFGKHASFLFILSVFLLPLIFPTVQFGLLARHAILLKIR